MTLLTDARILYAIWVKTFDPFATGNLSLTAVTTQEAWIKIAAAARLFDHDPLPLAHITPGLLYIVTWDNKDAWGDVAAPLYPQIGFTIETIPGFFVIEAMEGNVPVINHIRIYPKEVRRIPGMVYPPFPPIGI